MHTYLRVYPRHAPALGMPLHSRYIRLSRWAVLSSEGLLKVFCLVAEFVFCGGLVLPGVANDHGRKDADAIRRFQRIPEDIVGAVGADVA